MGHESGRGIDAKSGGRAEYWAAKAAQRDTRGSNRVAAAGSGLHLKHCCAPPKVFSPGSLLISSLHRVGLMSGKPKGGRSAAAPAAAVPQKSAGGRSGNL